MSQQYPPDTVTPHRWQRGFLDDITGRIVREADAVRDLDGLLRDRDDLGEPDRDHILVTWRVRGEQVLPEP